MSNDYSNLIRKVNTTETNLLNKISGLEKEVLSFFGFKTPSQLSFNWQFLKNANDESKEGYVEEFGEFLKDFNFVETLQESIVKFTNWIKNIK